MNVEEIRARVEKWVTETWSRAVILSLCDEVERLRKKLGYEQTRRVRSENREGELLRALRRLEKR